MGRGEIEKGYRGRNSDTEKAVEGGSWKRKGAKVKVV